MSLPSPSSPSLFEQVHERLDAQLHAHLLAVAGADFALALRRVERWHRALLRHIAIENSQLLPHVPDGARWAARVYLLEHERIALLAEEYLAKVQACAARPPRSERARRQAVLALLDAAHALRHGLYPRKIQAQHRQDGSPLDADGQGIQSFLALGHVQQGFRQEQVARGADRQIFGQAFHNAHDGSLDQQ